MYNFNKSKSASKYKNTVDDIIADYEKQLGKADKTIYIGYPWEIISVVSFFQEKECMLIVGDGMQMLIPFRTILRFQVLDKKSVTQDKLVSTTKTDGWNAANRAVVGNLIGGDSGAIIGGVTAKKTTVTTGGNMHEHHKYTLEININSITDPVINLYCSSYEKDIQELYSTLNVILQNYADKVPATGNNAIQKKDINFDAYRKVHYPEEVEQEIKKEEEKRRKEKRNNTFLQIGCCLVVAFFILALLLLWLLDS